MTPSPDLIRELQASRPVAPAALRTQVREIAAAEQAPPSVSIWSRLRVPVRRVALVAVPAALALAIASAGVLGLSRSHYRARVGGENAPTPVLVAKQLIPKGTPGSIVASQAMYAPTTVPRKETEVGSIADPSYLAGRAASADILPGQQFTAEDFAAVDTLAVSSPITGATQDSTVGPSPDRAQLVSATLTVEVRDSDAVSRAAQDALELTRSLGGHVVSASVATGEEGSASLTVRVPVDKVQRAIVQLSGLGRIVSQQVTIDDLQETLDTLERRESSLRAQIARINARLETESLDAETRAVLTARRARLQGELRQILRGISSTNAEARMATIQLSVVTPDALGVVPVPSRLDRTLDEALNVLVWEGVVALAIAIVVAPFALVALAAWLGRRFYRRREDERLLMT
jgi:hypothetical protein